MSNFDSAAQSDLLAAAVRFYEAEMYDHCMLILSSLMALSNKEAYILAGHCIAEQNNDNGDTISTVYYDIACELGSAVGCYNSYLVRKKTGEPSADDYMKRAVDLGWID